MEQATEDEEIRSIVEKDKYRGCKKGNKPKSERRIYSRKEEGESKDKQELRSNEAVRFISHSANRGKWWDDPQIREEDWLTT
jgi:hypothetical protein